MENEGKGLPKLGLRNIKTALSVLVSFLISRILGRDPIYVVIAAVMCTKDTVENSFKIAKSRVIGTVIGGIIGAVFLSMERYITFTFSFEVITSFGIMVVIYLCNAINKKSSSALSSVIYLMIMLSFKNSEYSEISIYAFNRTMDTILGVILSIVVNAFLFPYKKKNDSKSLINIFLTSQEEENMVDIDSKTELYCLIGNPIEKSLSPDIHNYSFERLDKNAKYVVFNIEEEKLGDFINAVGTLDIKGFNVTIPHKIEVIKYLDEIDEEAELLGAVNTVLNTGQKLIGYNTDGRGYLELLKSEKIEVKDKKVLILGAGGAARAIAITLAIEEVEKITVLNRTQSTANRLAEEIREKVKKTNVKTTIDSEEEYKEFDILINCTSIGMYPNIEETPIDMDKLSNKCIVSDIVYKPMETQLIKDAKKNGNKTIKGIGMLINQALLSEEIWFEHDIDKKPIVKEIKDKL